MSAAENGAERAENRVSEWSKHSMGERERSGERRSQKTMERERSAERGLAERERSAERRF